MFSLRTSVYRVLVNRLTWNSISKSPSTQHIPRLAPNLLQTSASDNSSQHRSYFTNVTYCSDSAHTTTLSYYEVSLEELKSLLQDPEALVIDVRNPEELKEHGVLPGSLNIPLPELGSAFHLCSEAFQKKYGREKPDFDSDIIFSCMAGVRSTRALKLARDMGFTEARHFPYGWKGWSASASS